MQQELQDADLIGRRIRQRRKEMELTQAELSAKMQARGHARITREYIKDFERGKLPVRHTEVLGFARVFRCPPWWLLGMSREEAAALDTGFRED